MCVASSTLRDHVMSNLTIDPTSGPMVLPPRDAVREVTWNEEANFPRRKAVVSHGLVVGQLGHDGLC